MMKYVIVFFLVFGLFGCGDMSEKREGELVDVSLVRLLANDPALSRKVVGVSGVLSFDSSTREMHLFLNKESFSDRVFGNSIKISLEFVEDVDDLSKLEDIEGFYIDVIGEVSEYRESRSFMISKVYRVSSVSGIKYDVISELE